MDFKLTQLIENQKHPCPKRGYLQIRVADVPRGTFRNPLNIRRVRQKNAEISDTKNGAFWGFLRANIIFNSLSANEF
jgi:hypothetical protein